MSDGKITAMPLRHFRVLIPKTGDDEVVLCLTDMHDANSYFIVSREGFVRIAEQLGQDAMQLSTMQMGVRPS